MTALSRPKPHIGAVTGDHRQKTQPQFPAHNHPSKAPLDQLRELFANKQPYPLRGKKFPNNAPTHQNHFNNANGFISAKIDCTSASKSAMGLFGKADYWF